MARRSAPKSYPPSSSSSSSSSALQLRRAASPPKREGFGTVSSSFTTHGREGFGTASSSSTPGREGFGTASSSSVASQPADWQIVKHGGRQQSSRPKSLEEALRAYKLDPTNLQFIEDLKHAHAAAKNVLSSANIEDAKKTRDDPRRSKQERKTAGDFVKSMDELTCLFKDSNALLEEAMFEDTIKANDAATRVTGALMASNIINEFVGDNKDHRSIFLWPNIVTMARTLNTKYFSRQNFRSDTVSLTEEQKMKWAIQNIIRALAKFVLRPVCKYAKDPSRRLSPPYDPVQTMETFISNTDVRNVLDKMPHSWKVSTLHEIFWSYYNLILYDQGKAAEHEYPHDVIGCFTILADVLGISKFDVNERGETALDSFLAATKKPMSDGTRTILQFNKEIVDFLSSPEERDYTILFSFLERNMATQKAINCELILMALKFGEFVNTFLRKLAASGPNNSRIKEFTLVCNNILAIYTAIKGGPKEEYMREHIFFYKNAIEILKKIGPQKISLHTQFIQSVRAFAIDYSSAVGTNWLAEMGCSILGFLCENSDFCKEDGSPVYSFADFEANFAEIVEKNNIASEFMAETALHRYFKNADAAEKAAQKAAEEASKLTNPTKVRAADKARERALLAEENKKQLCSLVELHYAGSKKWKAILEDGKKFLREDTDKPSDDVCDPTTDSECSFKLAYPEERPKGDPPEVWFGSKIGSSALNIDKVARDLLAVCDCGSTIKRDQAESIRTYIEKYVPDSKKFIADFRKQFELAKNLVPTYYEPGNLPSGEPLPADESADTSLYDLVDDFSKAYANFSAIFPERNSRHK